jgi:uncharacterized repeat protein (TIGR01451 family)
MIRYYSSFLLILISTCYLSAQECNDSCPNALSIHTINPTDPNCGDFTPITIEGCLEGATRETEISSCGSDSLPTVWFQILVDEEAVQLGTSIQSSGTWKPIWAIYQGGCGSLSILNAGTIADPITCSNGDVNHEVHVVGTVQGQLSYWIAVSGEGVIDDPNFILNVWTSANCVSCIGDEGCNPEAVWEVTSRSSSRPLDDPLFCPGEEVTVCITYNYDASETGVDWLHGLIPDFGNGWDMDAFDPESVSVSPSNGLQWNDESYGACAPFITEQMPLLCTYYDPVTGKLRLCNTVCQACPCTGPLRANAPLPSGWFWSTNGGAGCDNDCSPSTHYGIGSVVVDISFCMNLKVRTFDDEVDCIKNRNLQINFQTTSDGVSGCWEDPIAECKLDKAQIGPDWNVDCPKGPSIVGNDAALVGEGNLNIAISNSDSNAALQLYVSFIDNPFVDGEQLDTFTQGAGIIDDYLINTSQELQVVKYIITSSFGEFLCNDQSKVISVLIYPVDFTNEVKIKLYRDLNDNEIFDINDNPIKGFKVTVPTNAHSYFSNQDGIVSIYTNKDTLPIIINATYSLWDTAVVELDIVTLDTFTYREVGFVPYIDSTYIINGWLTSNFRCSQTSGTAVGFTNFSPNRLVNGKAVLVYDDKIKNTIEITNDGVDFPAEKRIEWVLKDIQQGEAFYASHSFTAPPFVMNNDSLFFDFYVITDAGDTLAHETYSDLLRCGYDPNDKKVTPDRHGEENFILPSEDLQYTIRFQNLGNDTAYNVIIVDDLDNNLDLNTMVVLYASHDMITEASGDTVYFKFNNINLPDSMRSPLTSQGFVIFTIKPKSDLPEGTEINNTANIFFDFNAPVITNTILNTLVSKLPCPQDAIWIEESIIYVNPSNGTYNWYNCLNDSLIATTSAASFTPTVNGSYYCIIGGYFCASKSECIVYDKISSATSFAFNHIKIYPNPGRDEVSIVANAHLGSLSILRITDVNGRIYSVSSKYLDNQYKVDTSSLPSGIYTFIMRANNDQDFVIRWVKI